MSSLQPVPSDFPEVQTYLNKVNKSTAGVVFSYKFDPHIKLHILLLAKESHKYSDSIIMSIVVKGDSEKELLANLHSAIGSLSKLVHELIVAFA